MHSLLASLHIVSLQDHPTRPLSPRSVSPYESDDEVVWPLSSSSASAAEPGSHSEASDDDDDFVLLNKPRNRKTSRSLNRSDQSNARDDQSPGQSSVPTRPSIDTTTTAADLAQAGNAASPGTPGDRTAMATPIPPSERRWTAKRATRPPPPSSASILASCARETRPPPPSSASILASCAKDQRKLTGTTRRKAQKALKKEAQAAAVVAKGTTSEDKEQARKERKRATRRAARQRRRERLRKRQAAKLVPSVTKATPATVITTPTSPEMYEEASRFVTSYLASPIAKRDSVCRLTLLQSLIVELGFMSTALPTTLRAATRFIKAHVFLNVREYIAHRGQGQAAIQRLLFPSRNVLIKDIRRKGKPASLAWVKQQGLEVLLVSCYNH